AAWDNRHGKEVIAFFIGNRPNPQAWEIYGRPSVGSTAIDASLPHRTPDERAAMARTFRGITTWEDVCQRLRISERELPDPVIIHQEPSSAESSRVSARVAPGSAADAVESIPAPQGDPDVNIGLIRDHIRAGLNANDIVARMGHGRWDIFFAAL